MWSVITCRMAIDIKIFSFKKECLRLHLLITELSVSCNRKWLTWLWLLRASRDGLSLFQRLISFHRWQFYMWKRFCLVADQVYEFFWIQSQSQKCFIVIQKKVYIDQNNVYKWTHVFCSFFFRLFKLMIITVASMKSTPPLRAVKPSQRMLFCTWRVPRQRPSLSWLRMSTLSPL